MSLLDGLPFLPAEFKKKLGEEIEKIKMEWNQHDKKTETFYNDTMMALKALDDKLDIIINEIGIK